jgi:hypothetical protein
MLPANFDAARQAARPAACPTLKNSRARAKRSSQPGPKHDAGLAGAGHWRAVLVGSANAPALNSSPATTEGHDKLANARRSVPNSPSTNNRSCPTRFCRRAGLCCGSQQRIGHATVARHRRDRAAVFGPVRARRGQVLTMRFLGREVAEFCGLATCRTRVFAGGQGRALASPPAPTSAVRP